MTEGSGPNPGPGAGTADVTVMGEGAGGSVGCEYVGGVVSMRTGTVPSASISILSAAAFERSIIRPCTKGPRSFTLTITRRLFCLLMTVRRVPKGRDGCAAVNRLELKISPEAVGLPSNSGPYQDANPSCRNGIPIDCADVCCGIHRATVVKKAKIKRLFLLIPFYRHFPPLNLQCSWRFLAVPRQYLLAI